MTVKEKEKQNRILVYEPLTAERERYSFHRIGFCGIYDGKYFNNKSCLECYRLRSGLVIFFCFYFYSVGLENYVMMMSFSDGNDPLRTSNKSFFERKKSKNMHR